MFPTLYESTAKTFTTMGFGNLSDAKKCTVTEVRNGEYELELIYPISGKRMSDLTENRIIYASHEYGKPYEPFRIYKVKKDMDGFATVSARHISYELNFIPVMPFQASTCADAVAGLKTHAWSECDYDFHTDKDVNANFTPKSPKSIRESLGGTNGSVMDVFGTLELEWRNRDVYVWLHRGSNKGVSIRYGKNLESAYHVSDAYDVITGMMPYYVCTDGRIITLPEGAIENEFAETYPFRKTFVRDCTDSFSEEPTEEQLRAFSVKYMNRHNEELPSLTIKVEMVDLANTEQYKNIAPLESIQLCDEVNVYHEGLGINTTKKVIEYTWDVLHDKYESITLGTVARTNITTEFDDLQTEVSNIGGYIQQASQHTIENVTNAISGVNGGYVLFRMDANQKPYEILIMDTEDINTAQNVWRFNQNGWGHSSTGYGGTYTTAATIDGKIVADFIQTGTLNANLIKAGQLRSADGRSFVLDIENNSIRVANYDSFMELQNMLFQFDAETGLKISSGNSNFYTILSDTKLGFYQGNNEIAWLSNNLLYIQDVRVLGGFEIQSPDDQHYTRIYQDQGGVFCIQLMGDEE